MKIAGDGFFCVFYACNLSDLISDLIHQLTTRLFPFEC